MKKLVALTAILAVAILACEKDVNLDADLRNRSTTLQGAQIGSTGTESAPVSHERSEAEINRLYELLTQVQEDIYSQKKERNGFKRQLKRKFGDEAWSQIVAIDNVVVIPYVKIEGDNVEFTGMLYAVKSKGKFKYKMLSRKDVLKQKNKGTKMNLYNLGLVHLFESNILNEIDCDVAEMLASEIEEQFGEEVQVKSHARDVIIDCYEIVAYYQDCISFGSSTVCGPVYSEPVATYCNSYSINIGGGSSGDGTYTPPDPEEYDPCWDMDCFVEPCWRRVLGERTDQKQRLSTTSVITMNSRQLVIFGITVFRGCKKSRCKTP